MAILGNLKNKALEQVTSVAKAVGLLTRVGEVECTEAQTGLTEEIKIASHNFVTNDIVVFTALKGGSNLIVGRPYYVEKISSSVFKISQTRTFVAETWTTEILHGAGETKVAKLEEISNATENSKKYERQSYAFTSPAKGAAEATSSKSCYAAAGAKIYYIALFEGTTYGGESHLISDLVAISELGTKEEFPTQGTYTITSYKLDDLNVA